MVRKRIIPLLKPIAVILSGVAVALLSGSLGATLSQALLTGGDEDNRTSGISGLMIGTLAGVVLGGFLVGWLLRRLQWRVRHLGRVFVGPGLWIWFIFVARSLDWEHCLPQLGVAAVLLIPSVIGVSLGVGRAKSAG